MGTSNNVSERHKHSPAKSRAHVEDMQLLYEISQTLDQNLDLRKVAEPILELIATRTGMMHGTLTLLNRQTGEISIEAAHGLSAKQRDKGRYRSGEGVLGKVVASGRPIVVPQVSHEPLFLDRTRARKNIHKKDISFIGVPIKVGTHVVGTLSADRLYAEEVALDEDLRLLTIIASLIAQAVKLRQQVTEERQRLMEENERLQHELQDRFQIDSIVGGSKGMRDVFSLVGQVAKSDATVLIRGESGTGKELVAHAIHHNSLRSGKPYIKVNCAALPEPLLESELFGHEKGAFTGASTRKKGRFELAEGGTLFLDEVGEFSPGTQVRLLRVLQEREFERLGGSQTIQVNLRIVAATNRNLEEQMTRGEFREDLYYRLNVFPIHLPPLRERISDITLLADFFTQKYSRANGKEIRRISTPAIDMLMAYHWPGNVRELENCIERATLLSNDGVIHGHHLPPSLQTAEESGTAPTGGLAESLDRIECEMLIEALKSARGNCARAAKALDLTERIMGLRLVKHGIDYKRFRKLR